MNPNLVVSTRVRRVAVIGGGIGGLAAALAFARMGARVSVHEQAPAILEVGAGLQITPNGGRVLAALGLEAGAEAASIRSKAAVPMDALTGREITRFDLTGLAGPAYRFFHRAELIGLLEAACRAAGVDIHLGARIEEDLPEAELILAAEGIKSGWRGRLNAEETPFFTGQVAWRAVVPAPEGPLWSEPVARVWMAPQRHIVTYPMTKGRLNIVAVQERQQWAKEGWAHMDEPGNLRHAFRDVSGRIGGLLESVEQVGLWGLFRHEVATRWHKEIAPGCHVALLGDAAHPTLPFLAQGANLALEDAWVLAASCDGAEDMSAALGAYREARAPRVKRAIAAANANARKYHLSGITRRTAFIGLKALGKIAPRAYLRQYDWLYDNDVTAGDVV